MRAEPLERSDINRILPVVFERIEEAVIVAFDVTVTVVTNSAEKLRFRYTTTPEVTHEGARVVSYPRGLNPECEGDIEGELVGIISSEFIARGLPFADYWGSDE